MGLFFQELTRGEIYKRTQGKLTRQITCITIWVAAALLAWRIYSVAVWTFADAWMTHGGTYLKYGVPVVVLGIGLWLGYRIVNYAPFADFLIAVEAEMNKVSWPTQTELVRSSTVVIILIISLTATVFVYDLVLRYILGRTGIVPE
jgi:preprotein translocase subunit SecE